MRSHGEPSTSDTGSGNGANSNALPNNVELSAQRGVDQRQHAGPNDESSLFMTTMQCLREYAYSELDNRTPCYTCPRMGD